MVQEKRKLGNLKINQTQKNFDIFITELKEELKLMEGNNSKCLKAD